MITRVMKILRERTESVDETRRLGARLARAAAAGDVYCLDGDLGTGKTEFVRGVVAELTGEASVRSPTFSILNIYQTPKFPVYHFDFYRIENPRELDAIGFWEYIDGDGICLIEWGTMFPDRLPDHKKTVRLTNAGESSRIIEANFLF